MFACLRFPSAFVLCLLSFALTAATNDLAVATNDLSVAKQALRDGLWRVVRMHAGKVDSDEARLIVLESLSAENRWDEIAGRLKEWKDRKGDGFDYYRAVVAGDHAQALSILKKTGSAEGLVEVRLHEAETLAKGGDRIGAESVWRAIAAQTNLSERVLTIVSSNLMDVNLLRQAYVGVRSVDVRRRVGLRLGMALMRDAKTAGEGETLVRAIVKDAPDAEGAMEAYIAVADVKIAEGTWKDALEIYREAIEIWPSSARLFAVQEGRGWALQKLGRREQALEAFRLAGELATDDASRATALLKEGDVLSEMEQIDKALAKYREVTEKYPKTTVAVRLKTVLELREMESEGRRLYGEFRFDEAMKAFDRVAEADSARRQRMGFFKVLCLYGKGNDDAAEAGARDLVATCADPVVRSEATVWLAKFLYNRREWKESGQLFVANAESSESAETAAESLLWAARAALAAGDCELAIQRSTRLVERHPDSAFRAGALLIQGESLVEQARFDEAVLVFERVQAAEGASEEDKRRALVLKADALYAMGADNPVRYQAALDAYQTVRLGSDLPPSGRLVIAFKTARALEKLKRLDEAMDQYYTRVVLAYREGRLRNERFNDEARAAFSRAGLRLADEFESRGKERQALSVLELLAESDVPAAEEARKRMDRISNSGRFL